MFAFQVKCTSAVGPPVRSTSAASPVGAAGGVVSTVTVRSAVDTCPAASFTVRRRVWTPSGGRGAHLASSAWSTEADPEPSGPHWKAVAAGPGAASSSHEARLRSDAVPSTGISLRIAAPWVGVAISAFGGMLSSVTVRAPFIV